VFRTRRTSQITRTHPQKPRVGHPAGQQWAIRWMLRLFPRYVRNSRRGTPMRFSVALLVVLVLCLNVVVGCAPSPNQSKGTADTHGSVAGFWLGLWQGFIAPFVFVVSLFKSNINIYEAHNSGGWYNFGYLFGLACFFGGGGGRAARRNRVASVRPRPDLS
jgi:hypothetical protein